MASRLTLSQSCPQCGAPVDLREDQRVLSCGYCRVNLFVTPQDHLSYYAPAPERNRIFCFYAPYWRFRGIDYQVSASAVNHTILDTTLCATDFAPFPQNLGYRQQTTPLRFVDERAEGLFLRARVNRETFLSRLAELSQRRTRETIENEAARRAHRQTEIMAQLAASPYLSDRNTADACRSASASTAHVRGGVLQAFVGETVSAIYWPFFVDSHGRLCDGLTDEPTVAVAAGTDPRKEKLSGTAHCVRFLATLCPNCGWTLQGAAESFYLLCPKCGVSWGTEGGQWRRTDATFWNGTRRAGDLWLPFWRIRLRVDGMALNSPADLIRALNAPRVPTPAMEAQPLLFWVPGFKIPPMLLLKLTGLMTLAQPQSFAPEFPDMQ